MGIINLRSIAGIMLFAVVFYPTFILSIIAIDSIFGRSQFAVELLFSYKSQILNRLLSDFVDAIPVSVVSAFVLWVIYLGLERVFAGKWFSVSLVISYTAVIFLITGTLVSYSTEVLLSSLCFSLLNVFSIHIAGLIVPAIKTDPI